MTGGEPCTDGDDQRRTVVQDDELVSEAVIRLVATVDDSDPLDLPPLGQVIDPDGIDAVFRSTPGPATTRTLTVSYHGYTITISGTDTDQVCLLRES